MEPETLSQAQPAGARPPAPPPRRADGHGSDAPGASAEPSTRHLLTVTLEDYYHAGEFRGVVEPRLWSRFESRLEVGARATLQLLDEYGVRATFFVFGWVADAVPELVSEIAARGHEVASRGYSQRPVSAFTPPELREDLARAREALERASGQRVDGYRAADWMSASELWALDVLAEEGYAYDSSIAPRGWSFAGHRSHRFAHLHRNGARAIWEFPISALSLFGWCVPLGKGHYFRQLPPALARGATTHWQRTYAAPYVMCFHTWELDPGQPRITAAPPRATVRHYRNLREMPGVLRHYLKSYQFSGIGSYLRPPAVAAPAPSAGRSPLAPVLARPEGPAPAPPPRAVPAPRTPVTIVVPCYNEEQTVPYLANTLASVQETLAPSYEVQLVLVDDASRDGTWGALHARFGGMEHVTLRRHEVNRGVAGSIMTGVAAASTEIVCSIDCDCSYDPHDLAQMIPLLTDGVDMVTASPYHPAGSVRNVPGWRLVLSRSLCAMYRVALGRRLRTFTSCFRVYRRSAVLPIQLERGGFLGVAEMLGKLALDGRGIAEYPTTLAVRIIGHSKMKVARTILGHVGLLAHLTRLRIAGSRAQPQHGASAPPAQTLSRDVAGR